MLRLIDATRRELGELMLVGLITEFPPGPLALSENLLDQSLIDLLAVLHRCSCSLVRRIYFRPTTIFRSRNSHSPLRFTRISS